MLGILAIMPTWRIWKKTMYIIDICLNNHQLQLCIWLMEVFSIMETNNSKSLVGVYPENMYNFFLKIDVVLGYTFMHKWELCIYITANPI